jgi:capsular exopolysaccharide synthesis family protein
LDLRRQLGVIRAWWPLIIASAILAGAVAFAVTNAQAKVYEARTTLIVGQSLSGVNPDYSQLLVSQRLSTTYATVATTQPILDDAIERLKLTETSTTLAQRVEAAAAPGSALLTITARDGDPGRAAAIANALASGLIAASPALEGRAEDIQTAVDQDLAAVREQINQTQAEVSRLTNKTDRTTAEDSKLETLQARLITLRSTYAELLSFSSSSSANLLSVVQPATAPESPISPRPPLTALLAALVGLLIALAIAFLADYLDDSVKGADEIQDVTGLPTLGTIERMKGDRRREMYRLATLLYPRSSAAEAFRTLRANVEFASIDRPLRTLLVTSALPSEGKTVTSANLALAFAQNGRRVLLVDADLRRPGIDEIMDLSNTQGLTTLLRSDDSPLSAVVQHTENAKLDVLTTGPVPPNPAELLGSQRMRKVVASLEAAYELVIFDSAPLQVVADAAILSSFVDGMLLVVDAGKSRRGSLREARQSLTRADATVLGAVINRAKAPVGSAYHGYYDASSAESAKGAQVPSAQATESVRD